MVRDHFAGKVYRQVDRYRVVGVRSLCCVLLTMTSGVGCSSVVEDTGSSARGTIFSAPLTSYDLLQEMGSRVMDGSVTGEEVLTMASVDKFGFMGTNPAYVSINGTKQNVASLGGLPKSSGQVRIVNGKLESTTQQAQVDPAKTH